MNIIPRGPFTPVTGFDAAVSFTAAFPPPLTFQEPPKVIPVPTFDRWASMMGYYPVEGEQATMVALRNTLRSKIHKAGLSQEWRDAGRVPFTLRVTVIGGYMAINLPMRSADDVSQSLGEKVRGVVNTKRRHLIRIIGAIDLGMIDPHDRDRIESTMESIEDAYLTMEMAIGVCTRQISRHMLRFPKGYAQLDEVFQVEPLIETIDEDDDRAEEADVADEMTPEEPETPEEPDESVEDKPVKKGKKGKKKG